MKWPQKWDSKGVLRTANGSEHLPTAGALWQDPRAEPLAAGTSPRITQKEMILQ